MHRTRSISMLASSLVLLLPSVVGCAGGASDDGDGLDAYDTESIETADDVRADAALDELLRHYWDPSGGYFHDTRDYWIVAQAFDAVLDGAQRTRGHHYMGWIRRIYDGQDARGWRREWFDDENWMALALVRAYDLTNDRRYLDRASSLFADIRSNATGHGAWGLCWDRSCSSKATASNAGPVITAVKLYERLHDDADLAFAKRVYADWRDHMVDGATGAVTDSITNAGTSTHWIDGAPRHWKFSYDEGLMIGAALALHRATHDAGYLADAHRVASFMLAHETAASTLGRVLDDHGTDCRDACEAFKGIAYRYLEALYLTDPTHAEYHDVLSASARTLWNDDREAGVDRFGVSWIGPRPASAPSLAADTSATMALNLYAILRADDRARDPSAPTPSPPPPPSCGRLHEDMTLRAGETLFACDGRHRLAMQTDGNLVLYDGGAPTWASHTQGSGADRADLQTDGNLVLYDPARRPKWASHTQGHAGVTLVVQDDGNLVLYASNGAPLWASHTQGR